MARPDTPAETTPRSPAVATSLSFLWPGLGQGYVGRRRAALLFAIPVGIAALALLVVAAQGLGRLAAILINPTTALVTTIVLLLLMAWRLLSMADAMTGLAPRQSSAHRRGLMVFAVLAIVTVATHGWASYAAYSFHEAGEEIFVAAPIVPVGPISSGGPSPSGAAVVVGPDARPTPFSTPETPSSRVNVLVIGVDSGEDRRTTLTDTMLVVSVDPPTGEIAMVSFPRDIADFPLPDGRTFRGKINSLMTWANNHPKEFPDGGLPTLAGALGHLLGVPIQYYAAINLDGFEKMVDAVGGVTVNNPKAINDPTYAWPSGRRGFRLSEGKHRLDGEEALAFVRTRKGIGDSDFGRARRQQELLLAIRREVIKPDTLARIPKLTKAAAKTIETNFPVDRIGEFIDIALALDVKNVQQKVLGPPISVRARGEGVTDYRIRLDMDKLAEASIELFGDDSRYADATGPG